MKPEAHENVSLPKPAQVPRPTIWPVTLALSVILILWGFVTIWTVTIAGVLLAAVAAAGWMKEVSDDCGE